MQEYNELKSMLRSGTCTIIFEKINGEERTMVCTLHPKLIPEFANKNDKPQMLTEVPQTPSNISVWDMESNGWRSFRINSIKSIVEFTSY